VAQQQPWMVTSCCWLLAEALLCQWSRICFNSFWQQQFLHLGWSMLLVSTAHCVTRLWYFQRDPCDINNSWAPFGLC